MTAWIQAAVVDVCGRGQVGEVLRKTPQHFGAGCIRTRNAREVFRVMFLAWTAGWLVLPLPQEKDRKGQGLGWRGEDEFSRGVHGV